MKKNVLVLYTDEQRYDSLNCTGNPFAVTPHLDALAQEGSVFTRHFAANTGCMPSRASFFTGLYSPSHGVYCNGVPLNRNEYIPTSPSTEPGSQAILPEPLTMADIFAQAGYQTTAFGKLHLTPTQAPESSLFPEAKLDKGVDWAEEWNGPYYGFERAELTIGHGEQPCWKGHYGAWLRQEAPQLYARLTAREIPKHHPIPRMKNVYPSAVPNEIHNNQWLADRFCEFIDQRQPEAAPFFTFIGFPDPHHPLTPSADILEQLGDLEPDMPLDPEGVGLKDYPRLADLTALRMRFTEDEARIIRRYTIAMLYQVDLAVGRILQKLKEAGLEEETIVVFTSDHGDYLGDHGLFAKSHHPCRSLLHVPFIMRAPGVEMPSRVDTVMSNCDVLPTLTSLAGLPVPAELHGHSYPADFPSDHRALSFCACGGELAQTNYTVLDDRYRMSYYPGAEHYELFDHEADPGECNNLADQQPQRVQTMRQRLSEEMLNLWTPNTGRVAVY